MQFDFCLISFSRVTSDSRTLNIAKTLSSFGSVAIIGLGNIFDAVELKKSNIELFPIEYSKGRAIVRWLKFIKASGAYLNDIKANVFCAEDFFSLPIAIKHAKINDATSIYDSREIYSALGPLSNSPIKQKIITKIEMNYALQADVIFSSGKLDSEFLSNYFKLDYVPEVIMNLPNYYEIDGKSNLRDFLKIDESRKILIYQGVLLKGRGLERTIKAMNHLDDWTFAIFGEGAERANLEKLVLELNLKNKIIFAGNVKHSDLLNYTAGADIGICFIEPISFSYELALPNKLFEYPMAGLPVLASDLPAMKEAVDKYKFGDTISQKASPEDLAKAISDIYYHKDKYKKAAFEAKSSISFESQSDTLKFLFLNK